MPSPSRRGLAVHPMAKYLERADNSLPFSISQYYLLFAILRILLTNRWRTFTGPRAFACAGRTRRTTLLRGRVLTRARFDFHFAASGVAPFPLRFSLEAASRSLTAISARTRARASPADRIWAGR